VRTDDRVNLVLTASLSTAVYHQPVTYTAEGTYAATGARIVGGGIYFRPFRSVPVVDGRASTTVFAGDTLQDVTATYSLGTAVCCTNTVHVPVAPAATTIAVRRSGDGFVVTVSALAPSRSAYVDGNGSLRVNTTTYTGLLSIGVATIAVPPSSAPVYSYAVTYGGNSRFLA